MDFELGDIITLCVGRPKREIEVEIVSLNPETGMPAKLKAVTPTEDLGQLGFIQEPDGWYHSERQISPN